MIASSVSISNPTKMVGSGIGGEGQPPAVQPGQLDPVDVGARPRDLGRRLLRGQDRRSTASKVDFTRNGSFLGQSSDRYRHRCAGQLRCRSIRSTARARSSRPASTRPQSLQLPQTSGTRGADQRTVNLTVNLPSAGRDPRRAATFDRFDPSTYNQSTATTIYDANGNAHDADELFRPRQRADQPAIDRQLVGLFVRRRPAAEPTRRHADTPITLTFDVDRRDDRADRRDHLRPASRPPARRRRAGR